MACAWAPGEAARMRSLFAHTDALAAELVHLTVDAAQRAIASRGRFTLALTGGSAASLLYPVLAQAGLDWARVHIFWGDERCVPPDHDDSNYRVARIAFLQRTALQESNIHRMRGEDADADDAARAYEQEILSVTDGTGALDVVHLGMGPDGHVCSLFPGHPLAHEEVRLVAALHDSPKPPPRRITLTPQALARARALHFLVAGAAKADAVRVTLTDPDSSLPAAVANRRGANVRWLLDADAGRLLTR